MEGHHSDDERHHSRIRAAIAHSGSFCTANRRFGMSDCRNLYRLHCGSIMRYRLPPQNREALCLKERRSEVRRRPFFVSGKASRTKALFSPYSVTANALPAHISLIFYLFLSEVSYAYIIYAVMLKYILICCVGAQNLCSCEIPEVNLWKDL